MITRPCRRGFTSITWYLFQRHAEGPYADGRRQMDWSLDSHVQALRISRAADIAGQRVSGLLVLSGADLDLNAETLPPDIDSRRTGLGDLRIGGTWYPIHDGRQRHYLGITALVLAPTGSYDGDRTLNVGENRWRTTLSVGWICGLGEDFTLDLMGELGWYADNGDYRGGKRLSQKPSHALTGYLRYRPGERLQLFVGGQYNGGGDLEVDGVDQGVYHPIRGYLGAIWSIDTKNHLNLRLGTDLEADNGFRIRQEMALRYIYLF